MHHGRTEGRNGASESSGSEDKGSGAPAAARRHRIHIDPPIVDFGLGPAAAHNQAYTVPGVEALAGDTFEEGGEAREFGDHEQYAGFQHAATLR
jgi:hypothetical protein